MPEILRKKIVSKNAKIAVIGLGYVGLPLAVSFAKVGFKVFGLDKDRDRVERLKKKQSYILDVDSKEIARLVKSRRLEASTDFNLLRGADVILICVPTPLKGKYTPDISFILSAVRTTQKFIKKGTLVVLESTTYPGTTRELVKPELEKSGLKSEKDFYLAFSPERIDPGNKNYSVTKISKVVGGLSVHSSELTRILYEKIIKKVHVVSSAEAAEMTKLLENSFRIINIGWINEIAMMCHKLKINVWEVIEAAKTKPFGFMPFFPGLGVGGHCIPEDPLYLYWKAKLHGFNSKFIKLAADINSNMPQYVIDRLEAVLRKNHKALKNARMLVIGVTYKKDVKDLRKSPSLKLIELLKGTRCKVDYFDPLIPYLNIGVLHMNSMKLTQANLSRYDCVVIATDHSSIDYAFLLKYSKVIFDTRNVYRGAKSNKVVRL
ncbi:MAG TPA: nucleotide sugar dehydrogenase [Candidatus Omnitrophota bacterium]|nr:nucleotide sugar dehydrogenase [Candidatus Omnitrophota bacterium]HPD84146.1 nucleotide sugar dehydrogenase [Candidatus Omnitrophota bacterium]HRZ03003.1 nucleotide sugar dehydrogenase [Candidatus Omnitrophota bacterium]